MTKESEDRTGLFLSVKRRIEERKYAVNPRYQPEWRRDGRKNGRVAYGSILGGKKKRSRPRA